LGPQFDPAAIAKGNGQRRTDDLLVVAITRLGIVSERFPAVECIRCEPTPVLPARRSRRSKRVARVTASGGQGKSEAEWMRSQRRRVRREAEERKRGDGGDQPRVAWEAGKG